MPNSVLGLIFLIIFLAPGFVAILEIRRKVPLFAAGQSQIEFVLWGCLAGLATHICLIVLIVFISFVVCGILSLSDSSQVTLLSCFTKKIVDLTPDDFKSVEIWHLLLGLLYVLIAFGAAIPLGTGLSRRFLKKGFGIIDYRSPWIEAFSPDHVNFARAVLDNNYTVTGIVESIQSDFDSLMSGNRDIVFHSADIINPDGAVQPKIADRITINTRNVKILEIVRETEEEKGNE